MTADPIVYSGRGRKNGTGHRAEKETENGISRIDSK